MIKKTISLKNETDYIPEYDLKEWQEEIIKRVNEILLRKDKAIVNIAGASASGKGEATEFLFQKLIKEGKNPLVISTDNFYKGASQIITEKLQIYFPKLKIDWKQVKECLKSITADKEFNDKFSDKNLELISACLKEKFQLVDSEQIISLVSNKLKNIDFDNPDAVDLDSVSKILVKIINNEEVELPIYSMRFLESEKKNKIKGNNYNVILVEGIYGLNERVVNHADIKTFIEADKKTLLMRRFRRDVLFGRSAFSPETVLWINLEIVFPAYYKYIYPDRSKSDLILKNDYTGTETFDTKTYDVQDKIFIKNTEIDRIEKILGKPDEVKNQKDFYFTNEDEIFNPEHLIRLREENGRLKELVHKGTRIKRDDGKILRPTETYIKDGEFGVKYKSSEDVSGAFRKAGFKLATEISKIRKIYKKSDIEINFDRIEGMGSYIEIKTDNKLSKSPEIDKIKQELGLIDRKPVASYADEYFAKIKTDPELVKRQEIILNQGLSREFILTSGACEVVGINKEIEESFKVLRRGYPEKSLNAQCVGREFRENADVVLKSLANKTIKNLDSRKVVVLMPWRSGLAFTKSYKSIGVENFYHLSSKRDGKTLKTMVDFEFGQIKPNNFVVITDPMIATGNTIIDSIERVLLKGVLSKNIIINSLLAVPVGIQKIKKIYPEVKIIVGSVDEKLDHKGYIVPGLGDFGDKYFADLPLKELNEFVNQFNISESGRKKMLDRIKEQSVSEVMTELIERDLKDMEISELNRKELIEKGLLPQKPKKIITIDTGRIEGVENVSEIIRSNVDEDVKIIALEGQSGTGKSATAKKLSSLVGGQIFSMGEIFRYLVYIFLESEEKIFAGILSSLAYKIIDGKLKLFDGELNISDNLRDELRKKEIEASSPEISVLTQKEVVEFTQRQISDLKRSLSGVVIVEGRSFTLDFLPSDLRVKLVADPSVRAERRWAQEFFKN